MIRNSLAVAALAAVVSVGLASAALADETGLKRGDRCSPFDVDDITGPNKGKQLCYV